MRYFCFTYQYITYTGYAQGNYYIKSESFPNKYVLDKEIKDLNKTTIEKPIIFLNIFEFKNEEDYNNFFNN